MKSAMERIALAGIRGDHLRWRAGIAALGLLLIIYMGSGATAWALQILEASDHAELTAEISDSDVNRIALDGDRVSRVIQSPGGFTVEHDAVRGDLYLYPDAAAVFAPAPDNLSAPAGAPAPVTLYLGTEQGFTYRLSLSVVSRTRRRSSFETPRSRPGRSIARERWAVTVEASSCHWFSPWRAGSRLRGTSSSRRWSPS